MKVLALVCVSVSLWFITASAQAPGFEGTWYGSIKGPGSSIEIALNLQKNGDSWSGVLLLQDGTRVPLKDIVVQPNTISFALDAGPSQVTFSGKVPASASEIEGDFTQAGSTFPFKLSRNMGGAQQAGGLGLDASELIAMMTPYSGNASDRPFVPPLTHPAVGYGSVDTRDPLALLKRDIQDGKVQFKSEGQDGYLRSLLDILKIPVESQVAVFSKNSLQSGMIGPENPRLLYFNDSVALGIVRGGFIEIASQDPERGINFYMLPQDPAPKPFSVQRDDCLRCHVSRNTMDIPGMLLRSVYPSKAGIPINSMGSHLMDHRTKYEDRWGGWYVTGNSGSIRHLGNAIVPDPATESMTPLKDLPEKYPSDIVALMVFQHQMHLMNLITRVGWEYRIAAFVERGTGKRNEVIDRQLRDATNELVDYMLFVDEPALPNKIAGKSGFAEKFASLGPSDSKGRSLRQFDLERRMMRYPVSYMIYSPGFDALPADAKKAVYERMRQVMASRFSAADRDAILEILRETKKDF